MPPAAPTVVEPNLVWNSVVTLGLPFLAYFLGIIIRKVALPGKDSPPLSRQLLLGVPMCLVIVSPSIAAVGNAVRSDVGAYLFILGVLMEHGMLVQETATRQLHSLLKSETSAVAGAGAMLP
jgi:hypothetical protein